MEKKILQTFDYELFLGKRSGSVDKCLIEPTNHILSLFKKHNFKGAIFFVDTTYLYKLKQRSEQACIKDFNKIANQLLSIIDQGHYIFPHIHPHWLDAIYLKEINQWNLSNYSKYRFNLITENEKQIVFDESMAILKDIILPEFPNYKIDGYRAGGWCIQPFSDFKPYFIKHQIKHEFSVLTGHSNFTKAHYYNFINAPNKNIYSFENEVDIELADGQFKQFSISSVELNSYQIFKEKLFLKYLKFKKVNSFGDGIGLVLNANEEKIENLDNVNKKNNLERVSIELLNIPKLKLYKRFIDSNDYMHFISHPKMINTENLKSIEKFMLYVSKKYTVITDFKKF